MKEPYSIYNPDPNYSMAECIFKFLEQPFNLKIVNPQIDRTEFDILNNGFDKLKDDAFTQFIKGKQEHGGNLIDKNCRKFRKQELRDYFIYDLFEDIQIEEAIAILENILHGKVAPCDIHSEVQKAVNLLNSGNTENKQYNE